MADDPNTISTSSLAGPISPLRQRMLEDMTIRRLAPGTQAAYLSAVSRFSRHFGRSPDKLSYEDVRAWQLHLVHSGLAANSVNRQITALRFFFRVTLGQRYASQMIPQAREPERLREVLRPDEVARLIEAAPHPKYRAALSLAYGAGLRVSQVIGIKVSDIERVAGVASSVFLVDESAVAGVARPSLRVAFGVHTGAKRGVLCMAVQTLQSAS